MEGSENGAADTIDHFSSSGGFTASKLKCLHRCSRGGS